MTDQPHSRTPDEMAVARAIGDFTEHQAGIPPRLKALAVNAVGPALQARGEWLRLATRQAVAVAVLVAVKADLEASIDTTPAVAGRCPACRGESLMLTDGHVVCRRLDCPDPTAAHDAIEERGGANAYGRAINTAPSKAAAAAIRQSHNGTLPRRRVRRTTPDNPATSSDGADNSEAAVERLRAENAAAQSLIRMQDEAIQRVRTLANRLALDSPWGRDTARQFRLAVQPPAPDGPTVAEAAADDKRHWGEREWGAG